MVKSLLSFERLRNSLEYRTGVNLKRRYPTTAAELERSDIFTRWWYYSIELLPGLITRGVYPTDLPMLPRLMLRRCDLNGMSCLDMGSMEGLIPTLMVRGGARDVLAIDAVDHCLEKLKAVQHYYSVNFDYRSVGLMYDLHEKLPGRGFDLINCSGLLYHVFSPLMLLCGLRPLLKKNGLMIVSTNVVLEDGYTMDFNNSGRMQVEANTFWYISVKLFDYLLRYLKLAPIDALFTPHTAVHSDVRYVFAKSSGYLSVLCRATGAVKADPDDQWMADSANSSWEYLGISSELLDRQPESSIRYKGELDRSLFSSDSDCLDLWEVVNKRAPVAHAEQVADSHILRLTDQA
jgi:2-polyprenyl-3-methyl-5-hydroxy-6-metoxy-1,4-benzoquinol methylase